MTETWINPKEAADFAHVGKRTFMRDWIPETGPAQVRWRNTNGKTGKGRRPEVLLEDLEAVMASRTFDRAG